ncbi:MAG: toxin-antitoxin system HicB family antitoxin [Lautropia sp.]|nr:toxin-antitoxin system HicB family antitoxin [Lautropia sp.]
MTALTIRLPDSVHRKVKELAARDGISVNQFIASATAEKMAAFLTLDHLRQEASLARREDFLAVMNRVPDAEPMPGDELRG